MAELIADLNSDLIFGLLQGILGLLDCLALLSELTFLAPPVEGLPNHHDSNGRNVPGHYFIKVSQAQCGEPYADIRDVLRLLETFIKLSLLNLKPRFAEFRSLLECTTA